MFKQLSLLQEQDAASPTCFYRNLRNSGFNYEEVNIGDITFKAGQYEAIHRWYRLTPSFAPSLVRYVIQEFEVAADCLVVDPFCGRGTTVIECQKLGIHAVGIEINPLLQQVGEKSLLWKSDHLNLVEVYLRELDDLLNKHRADSVEAVLLEFNAQLPVIHNVFRWWKEEVLKDLIICRELMLAKKYKAIFNYLWLAVNKAALDCANIHRNHPTITFDDNHQRVIDVPFEVGENLKIIVQDLAGLSEKEIHHSQQNSVVLGNSTQNLEEVIKRPVDFVITSPPYPNRYSYVHQTRPQLHFMNLLEDIRQATEIDLNAIGGTWGRATSILQNELIEVPDEIRPYLSYYDELKERSVLMCNYATKYFLGLWQHIKALKQCVADNFRGAYVVGNSRLSGIEIFTEVIFGKICEHIGLHVEKIISFRKRGGRQRLYETAVCLRN